MPSTSPAAAAWAMPPRADCPNSITPVAGAAGDDFASLGGQVVQFLQFGGGEAGAAARCVLPLSVLTYQE